MPEYLPAVPLDPTAGAGVVIRYKPGGAVLTENMYATPIQPLPQAGPAILYCLGRDGDDDGGLIEVDRYDGTLLNQSKHDREEGDSWFLLDTPPAGP